MARSVRDPTSNRSTNANKKNQQQPLDANHQTPKHGLDRQVFRDRAIPPGPSYHQGNLGAHS
ncbi:MAG: hypothetical protein RL513_144, partial [Pseudomonadota bacterium]